MPEFYIIIERKIFFPKIFWGYVPPLSPVSYAYACNHRSGVRPDVKTNRSKSYKLFEVFVF